jgi:hypothetical protein
MVRGELKFERRCPHWKTYLWFVLKWVAIAFAVSLLCFVLLKSGNEVAGFSAMLLAAFLFVRDCRRIGRRAKRGVRRTYNPADALPELRTGQKEKGG